MVTLRENLQDGRESEAIGTIPVGETETGKTRYLLARAQTRTRQQWLEYQPENERTLVECDECQETLRTIRWVTNNPHGFGYFKPVYEECSRHPQLFSQWVADLTQNMNYLHQRR